MINIKLQGIDEAVRNMRDLSERRVKAAAATAMTRTAVAIRNEVQQHMTAVLDRPTPYTLRQLRYVAASAQRLVAAVGFNIAPIQDEYGRVVKYRDLGPGQTNAGKYLQTQMTGGPRPNKRFESALRAVGVLPPGWFAVPGIRAKIDAYGNQSVGELRQILSWFDAAEMTAGSTQNMRQVGRDKRRRGTRKAAGFEYVAIMPGAKGGLRPGIYRRTFYSLGRSIEPVVIFVQRVAYRKRFDFDGIAQRGVSTMLGREFDRALRESLARKAAQS